MVSLYSRHEFREAYHTLEHVLQETSLNVLSTADLLNQRLAFLTGGTSHDCPILTFPDNSKIELTQENYKKLISYLTQVPTENERQCGFVLIIDRRSDTWNTVKTIISYIEDYFPYSIQCIYLLRPNSFMQRALSHLAILNDITCSYRLIICRSLSQLYEYVDVSQLSKDLGGLINFRLFEWIEQRVTIEKLTQSIHELNEILLAFIKEVNEVEFPNNVESIDAIVNQNLIQKNHIERELQRIKTLGHSLLCIIHQENKQSSASHHSTIDKHNDVYHIVLSPDQSAHARACIGALVHIDTVESTLSQFWSIHKTHLNYCLELRHFERRFKQIQNIFLCLYNEIFQLSDINISQLALNTCGFDNCNNNNNNNNNNTNLREEIDQRLIQVDALSQQAETMISHATRLANDGLALMMEQQKQQSIPYGNDSIEPKRQELEEMKKKLIEQIDEKRHNLKLLKKYIDKLGFINDWCVRGKDMLSMHSIHLSNDNALRSIVELESFLTDLSIMNIEELQHTSTPEPLRSMISQVFNRVNDIRDLCEKRCEQLRQLVRPIYRPFQYVHPLPLLQHETFNVVDSTTPILKHRHINEHTSKFDVDSNRLLLSSSNNESSINHNVKMDKKQRHVVTELLATEQVYVEELRSIIEGYMIKFDDPEQFRFIPPIILQNKTILFSNLPDIYAFHATSFLRDLQQIYNNSFVNNTCSIGSAIASCFIKRKSNFKLYEQYVLNKSQSERLWEQYCCGHPFFTKIQQSLGHRLPLDSYLLKPIQRITQYHLLLKEMIKYTHHEQERKHLQESLYVMLNILSHLNDVMHSTQIVGYPDQMQKLGQIRLRGENCIISKEKRRGTVYTRTKTCTRDIFLFERVILLCKKKDEGNGKSLQYQFKEMIKITDIAVCTYSKNDRNKFEIVLKDYSYIVQLSSNGEKLDEMNSRWIDAIKNCITKQTEQRRAEVKHRSSSLDPSTHSHRRRSLTRKVTFNRAPESDDEQAHSPITLIDLNDDDIIQNNKLGINSSFSLI
ncbi:unnamed protein product [Rotaria magnacalcarata]|uniref:Uncharacterized protein n=2 Tax=Rotaria magnacalcarata TaxID=392030 RepID=A0A815Z967_9BILA|nr:unnamed protein product [Rotaria magnacalcarata]CAF1579349.1 unnamed protein product [Rotaria magnacalcarata]